MKKFSYTLTILSLAIITITACKKDKHTDDDHQHGENGTPVISVTTINEGDTIQPNFMVHISGTIVSTSEMHGYNVKLHNHATMTDVLNETVEGHESSYNFDEHWTNNVTDTSNMVLTISAVIDHDGNLGTKTINFVCLP